MLLDTHIFLWLLAAPERLGRHLASLENAATPLFVSAASSWEIAIKVAAGKLELPEDPLTYVPDRIAALGARALVVEHEHALTVATLPPLHRDPFDRLLVAQAMVLDVPLMTADDLVIAYPVTTIDVRR